MKSQKITFQSDILCTVSLQITAFCSSTDNSQITVVRLRVVLLEVIYEELTADKEPSADMLSVATLLVQDFWTAHML